MWRGVCHLVLSSVMGQTFMGHYVRSTGPGATNTKLVGETEFY